MIDDALDALSSAPTAEARQRSVICRAYYAAYHFLRGHPCGKPFVVGTAGSKAGKHKEFIYWLYASPDPCVLKAAQKLDILFADRVTADYDISGKVTKKMAEDALDQAAEIVDVDLTAYDPALDKRTYP